MASISSINIMLGASFLAFSKRVRTLLAPTPTYFSTNSDPVTLKNDESVSPATADAKVVDLMFDLFRYCFPSVF